MRRTANEVHSPRDVVQRRHGATVEAIEDTGLVVERAEIVEEALNDGSVERFLWVTAVKRD